MVTKLNMTRRKFKDPTALTPYEQSIKDLKDQGKSFEEIAQALGKNKAASVAHRYKTIREKLEANGS